MQIQRAPISIYAEATPNPEVMKFVANKMLIQQDSVEYQNIEEAAPSPLAQELFKQPYVKAVFISGNFIAVSKYNVAEWEEVGQELRLLIAEWLHTGKKVMKDGEAVVQAMHDSAEAPATDEASVEGDVAAAPEELGEIEQRIIEILDEYIKPAVAQDGGNIAFVSYENKIVTVQLQGACAGCPSSQLTLNQGIKAILQRMLPTLVDDVIPTE